MKRIVMFVVKILASVAILVCGFLLIYNAYGLQEIPYPKDFLCDRDAYFMYGLLLGIFGAYGLARIIGFVLLFFLMSGVLGALTYATFLLTKGLLHTAPLTTNWAIVKAIGVVIVSGASVSAALLSLAFFITGIVIVIKEFREGKI